MKKILNCLILSLELAVVTPNKLLAEIGIGIDISNQFPSASYLYSWAGMVPGNNESAGKKSPKKREKAIKNCEPHLLKQHIRQPGQKTPTYLPNTNVWRQELVKNAQQLRLDIPY
ncbi:transposase [Neobacillus cucumis]|uniref:transposase n=1 Tax=Neobacillus cucumis TaxID=1740721 RepID=UPI002E1EAC52|nr:transposase [Neobacillus cucumis]MED4229129.1 transposase [Neobacillus cucumis]